MDRSAAPSTGFVSAPPEDEVAPFVSSASQGQMHLSERVAAIDMIGCHIVVEKKVHAAVPSKPNAVALGILAME